jgi:hypothetical protein
MFMSDNFVPYTAASFSSLLAVNMGWITVSNAFEAAVYAVIAGFSGYLSKKVSEKFYIKLKNYYNEKRAKTHRAGH